MMNYEINRKTPLLGVGGSRWLWLAGLIGLLLVVYLISLAVPAFTQQFPADWYLGVRPRVDAFQAWIIRNRINHPVFVYGIDPLKSAIDAGVRAAENGLLSLHWAVLVGAFALAGYALSGWRLALGCAISLFLFGLLGLWEQSMQTLALMLVAVLLSLLIGIPLGIACAFSDRVNNLLRPVLDGMQTMPAFVYLIPVVLFFGVARVPAVIATVIYAIRPPFV